jgi:hypothetical protein
MGFGCIDCWESCQFAGGWSEWWLWVPREIILCLIRAGRRFPISFWSWTVDICCCNFCKTKAWQVFFAGAAQWHTFVLVQQLKWRKKRVMSGCHLPFKTCHSTGKINLLIQLEFTQSKSSHILPVVCNVILSPPNQLWPQDSPQLELKPIANDLESVPSIKIFLLLLC